MCRQLLSISREKPCSKLTKWWLTRIWARESPWPCSMLFNLQNNVNVAMNRHCLRCPPHHTVELLHRLWFFYHCYRWTYQTLQSKNSACHELISAIHLFTSSIKPKHPRAGYRNVLSRTKLACIPPYEKLCYALDRCQRSTQRDWRSY